MYKRMWSLACFLCSRSRAAEPIVQLIILAGDASEADLRLRLERLFPESGSEELGGPPEAS